MSDDIAMHFQRLADRPVNIVRVYLNKESGCNWEDDEYSIDFAGMIGGFDMSAPGGTDDATLIRRCIRDHIGEYQLPPNDNDGCIELILIESGEWEDVFWHKYYEIARAVELHPKQQKLGRKVNP